MFSETKRTRVFTAKVTCEKITCSPGSQVKYNSKLQVCSTSVPMSCDVVEMLLVRFFFYRGYNDGFSGGFHSNMDTELFMECEEEELEPWQQVDDSVEEDDMDFMDNYGEPGESQNQVQTLKPVLDTLDLSQTLEPDSLSLSLSPCSGGFSISTPSL